ncbi:siderophore ABC transporter substrate-binding protein [Heyndrickxia acidiproducens]|uniref:siderophore ABC transporter substrate-binding protein n=1 Tax=Heyndrickxia acidiproducens TaxID=1121084 RepID=UPI000361B44D|nr:siderophore ABC transporter substrate-binding protein [Heyndrickxia acidiproducens]
MKKRMIIGMMVFVLAIFAAGCGTKESSENSTAATKKISVKHELGTTKVAENPKKVVVFDFGVLDSLDQLGIKVTGVPQDNIPSYLKQYKSSKYENVGGVKEPDFDKISQIHPDLIIISGRQRDSYKEFSKIAPTIYMGVDDTRYFASFKENMETLGKIFNQEHQVHQALTNINDSIDHIKAKTKTMDEKALIVMSTGGKVSAYGPGSRFGMIHDVFGVPAADKNIKVSTHGQNVSFEYIAKQNPDYLFVIDRDAAIGEGNNAKSVIENDLVKKTKAYKENHIAYLDPGYWYLSGGGLESVSEMVKEVEKAIE